MEGRILFAAADAAFSDMLLARLARAGVESRYCSRGREVVEVANTWAFDAAILDLDLVDIDVVELCRALRRSLPDVGLLVSCIEDAPVDAVLAYEAGADDFFVRATDPTVIEAKVRRTLRRRSVWLGLREPRGNLEPPVPAVARVEDMPAVPDRMLTRLEERLLVLLSRARGGVVGTEELLVGLWGRADVDRKQLYEHVSTLRGKLVEHGWTIANVRSRGYRLQRSGSARSARPAAAIACR